MSELLAANRRGIVAMSLGMVSFVANDAIIKQVSASLPSGQLIFIRGLFAIALLLALCSWMGLWRSPGGGLRALGQRSVLTFSAFEINPALKADAFQFHPPAGTDVIRP